MTEHTHHTELIDSYLSGTMSSAEQSAFLDLIDADPVLKDEFLFQQGIVDGLHEYRKAELKNRLSSISIGIGFFGFLMNSTLYQVMASVLTVGLIGAGSYFAYNELYLEEPADVGQIVIESIDTTADHPTLYDFEIVNGNRLAEIVSAAKEIEETIESSADQEKLPGEKAVRKLVATNRKNVAKEAMIADNSGAEQSKESDGEGVVPQFEVPTIDDEPTEEDAINFDVSVGQRDDYETIAEKETNKVEVEQVSKKGKNLQYKFEQGKLYLYGDFHGEPYELLEINTNGTRSLFFYHEKKYYRLNQFQKSVTGFTAITDRKLLKELEIIRTNR